MSRLRSTAVVIMVIALFLAGCQNPGISPAKGKQSIPKDISKVPRITPVELKRLLDAGEDVVVVDVRSRASYEQLHIPGALSIPLGEIEARHSELPREAKIVLYCT